MMENITLNNGITCPSIGIGTYMLSPAEAENSVREALKMGYSLVDTANAYMNERACGRGIRDSGLAREDVFILIWQFITDLYRSVMNCQSAARLTFLLTYGCIYVIFAIKR